MNDQEKVEAIFNEHWPRIREALPPKVNGPLLGNIVAAIICSYADSEEEAARYLLAAVIATNAQSFPLDSARLN